MNRLRLAGLSLAGGIALTHLTGIVPLRSLAGSTHYGLPMAWLARLVLAPEFFSWRVNWVGLVVDLVVWTVVVLVALVLYDRRSVRSTQQPT